MTLNYGSVDEFESNSTAFENAILSAINQTGVTIENVVATAGSVVVTYDLVFLTNTGTVTSADGKEMPLATFLAAAATTLNAAVAKATGTDVIVGFTVTAITSQNLPPSPSPPAPPPAGRTAPGRSSKGKGKETKKKSEDGVAGDAAAGLHPGIIATAVLLPVLTLAACGGTGVYYYHKRSCRKFSAVSVAPH